MQRLLLTGARQAAQTLGARARVDAALMSFSQRAGQAAAAARLLHRLTARGYGWTYGQRILIARLAWHVGGETDRHERDQSARAKECFSLLRIHGAVS